MTETFLVEFLSRKNFYIRVVLVINGFPHVPDPVCTVYTARH